MLSEIPMTYLESRMVNALLEKYPGGTSRDALIEALYFDDPGGGPLAAKNNIRVRICTLRKKLKRYGWTIPLNPTGTQKSGYTTQYRLARINPSGEKP